MKMFGHPLHLMLVHFPSALLPMDVVFSILGYYRKDPSFLTAAFFCLVAGVLAGIVAFVTGLFDLLRIPKEKKTATGTAIIHGFINTMVVLFFGVFAYKAWQEYPLINEPPPSAIIIKSILVLILFAGNYLGGKLIFTHHIGIKKTEA